MNSDSSPKQAVSWITLIFAGFLVFRGASRILAGNPGIWSWLCLGLGTLWLGNEMVRWWRFRSTEHASAPSSRPPAASPPGNEEPIRSLVFLLEAPRDASGTLWMDHIGQALGVRFGQGDDATTFVTAMQHPINEQGGECYMMAVPGGFFWILIGKSPYMDDPAGCAGSLRDRRLQDAVTDHKAWLSVDLVTWTDGTADPSAPYAVIGKAMAALAGPDVLAVFAPEINRLNVFDPTILPVLSGGTPLALFDDPTFSPVVGARDDDEQMEAAIAEARARWPEFVGQFQKRDPSDSTPFLVRAPFAAAGETEHMWIEVNDIGESTVHGILANHPHRLDGFHQGQQVKVPSATISDWVCASDDNRMLGGWTQKVLASQFRRNNG